MFRRRSSIFGGEELDSQELFGESHSHLDGAIAFVESFDAACVWPEPLQGVHICKGISTLLLTADVLRTATSCYPASFPV